MKRPLITLGGILLMVLVLYPLSAGPVARNLMQRGDPYATAPAIYKPLQWTYERCPALRPAWDAYMDLWVKPPPEPPPQWRSELQ